MNRATRKAIFGVLAAFIFAVSVAYGLRIVQLIEALP